MTLPFEWHDIISNIAPALVVVGSIWTGLVRLWQKMEARRLEKEAAEEALRAEALALLQESRDALDKGMEDRQRALMVELVEIKRSFGDRLLQAEKAIIKIEGMLTPTRGRHEI